MDTALTVRDVADLLFAARARIDFYWNFYAVVVIAVVGWLVTTKRALNVPMKALVSIAYVVASLMNLVGLYGSYALADALRTDLLRMAGATALTDTRLLLAGHSYLAQRWTAVAIHLIVGATFLIVLWFARPPSAEAEAGETVRT